MTSYMVVKQPLPSLSYLREFKTFHSMEAFVPGAENSGDEVEETISVLEAPQDMLAEKISFVLTSSLFSMTKVIISGL